MSTRSLIGFKLRPTKDGRPGPGIRAAYCHSDGYPEYVGRLLLERFNDPMSAVAIAGAGYISSLSETDDIITMIGESYNHTPPMEFDNETVYALGDSCGEEYVYLFMDGEWYVSEAGVDNFHTVAEQLADA